MDERTRRIAVEAELAALKARRCDGCVHWTPSPAAINGYAFCLLPNLQHDSPMAVELGREVPQMRADHACNAWTARA